MGSNPIPRSKGFQMSVKTWEEITKKLDEEARARGKRYEDIKAQSEEAAINDLKLQSSSPIWDNLYMREYFTDLNKLSDEDLELTILAEQDFRRSLRTMTTLKPITPVEASRRFANEIIPDEIIAAVNELIVQNLVKDIATITQHEIVELAVLKGLKREDIFENRWLDIEEVYRAAGWTVGYDKPGYNESYKASFTFRKRRMNAGT